MQGCGFIIKIGRALLMFQSVRLLSNRFWH